MTELSKSLEERVATLQKEFEQAQAELKEAKLKAKTEAIEQVKQLIREHVILPEDLGLPSVHLLEQRPAVKKKAKKSVQARTSYSDGTNTWSGWGKTPGWLTEAMKKQKKPLEAFEVKR